MSLRNQVLIWVGIFLSAILLLWVFRSILLPFVVGLALAYLLNPVVNWMHKIHVSRTWASMIVLTVVFGLIVSLFLAFVPLVLQQILGLTGRLPGYISDLQGLLQQWAPQFNEWLGLDPDPRISEWLGFVLILPIGFGLGFQLPLVMLFLERIGIVDVATYASQWRVAVIVIFVVSAVLTPADPYSLLFLAIPLCFLYFGGLGICRWFPRSLEKR